MGGLSSNLICLPITSTVCAELGLGGKATTVAQTQGCRQGKIHPVPGNRWAGWTGESLWLHGSRNLQARREPSPLLGLGSPGGHREKG